MTKTFNLVEFENHLIFKNNDQLILVDTGSPMTCANVESLSFMDKSYNTNTSVFQSIADAINYPIDVLLGLDILSHYYMLVDYKARTIAFSTEILTLDGGTPVHFERGLAGMLCTTITVNHSELNFVIDSGAKISYVDPELSATMTPLGEEEDFYPGMPRFTVPTYATSMSISNMQFDAVVGNLPSQMRLMLSMMGVNNIIGSDLFTSFQVLIDFQHTEMLLKPYQE